ncbi:conserved protein of unknown function [Nitrosotalea devaniterrae]|uniref:Uncharacterized protein n=1 Tax=Nitrosotalea devaniterrae TaxID=1078905 RepID=A0A128A1H0_9ARCH|nr:conserved protein of unknown function [Candidatus Nitrosotalea devanaterra]
MPVKGEILEKINFSGVSGIKKIDLKKTFGKDCEGILEELKANEQIFIEKKGVAYFVWTRENYVQHITQNDPKFKIILGMLTGVNQSLAKVQAHADVLQEELERTALTASVSRHDDFEGVFNSSLNESSTSIGWVPFDKIREKVCENQNLSKEKFYQMATNLIENHHDRYEISSGGQEGIVMRGLVHGYVRNI